MRLFIGLAAIAGTALSVSATLAPAQTGAMARAFSINRDEANRPRLGITTRSSGKRDTLGLLVDEVTSGGPADKAGIENGDRLVSVNAVNLKLTPDDAEDSEMADIATRRLTRELGKHKAGDDVELRVYHDGQTRTVHAKLVSADDLEPRLAVANGRLRAVLDRAALGISLGGSGSKRDTLGILVVGVNDDGPAAKAGIEEGDRLASVNGVDLRVEREDAGDWEASNARVRRLNRAMEKVKPGDDVELKLVAMGQSKTVHVKAARAGDIGAMNGGFFFDDGRGSMERMLRVLPTPGGASRIELTPAMPRAQMRSFSNDTARLQAERAAEAASRALEQMRRTIELRERALRERYPNDTLIAAPRASTPLTNAVIVSAGGRGGRLVTRPERAALLRYSAARAEAFSAPDAMSVSGLTLTPVGPDLASYLGDGSERGLVVVSANNRWPGVHPGDVILTIDGRPVRSANGSVHASFDSGRSVIELLRGGKRIEVTIDR